MADPVRIDSLPGFTPVRFKLPHGAPGGEGSFIANCAAIPKAGTVAHRGVIYTVDENQTPDYEEVARDGAIYLIPAITLGLPDA